MHLNICKTASRTSQKHHEYGYLRDLNKCGLELEENATRDELGTVQWNSQQENVTTLKSSAFVESTK